MALRGYHHIWLEAHPYRSADWLERALADGFDIHHIDGDRSNNDPDNLVLIECGDHFRLHGSPNFLRIHVSARRQRLAAHQKRAGEAAYRLMAAGAETREIERGSGYRFATARRLAKEHARRHAKYWPNGRIDRTPTPWP